MLHLNEEKKKIIKKSQLTPKLNVTKRSRLLKIGCCFFRNFEFESQRIRVHHFQRVREREREIIDRQNDKRKYITNVIQFQIRTDGSILAEIALVGYFKKWFIWLVSIALFYEEAKQNNCSSSQFEIGEHIEHRLFRTAVVRTDSYHIMISCTHACF